LTTISRDLGQFLLYRYAVIASMIPKGGNAANTIDLGTGVTELHIIKDFDAQIHPYFRLSTLVSANDFQTMQAAWKDAKVYLTVQKHTVSVDSTSPLENDTGQNYMTNVEFQVMTLDSSPSAVPTDQPSQEPGNARTLAAHLELAATAPMSVNKTTNNAAYHGAAIGDIVGALVTKNRPTTGNYKFYMAPPDNPKKYESIILPPLTLAKSIRYLDEVHGLYAGKPHVFLDVDAGYIMSSAKTIAPPAGGPQRVIIETGNLASTAPDQTVGSGYDPVALTYRLRTAQRSAVADFGPADKEVTGEQVRLVTNNQRSHAGSVVSSLIVDGEALSPTPKEHVVWQGYDNPLASQRMKLEARERYAPTTFQFQGPDLAAFNPTLPWTLQAGDPNQQKLEGNWRLRAMEAVLNRPPGTTASCTTQVMVRIIPAASGLT
jgi:hypothetical protein